MNRRARIVGLLLFVAVVIGCTAFAVARARLPTGSPWQAIVAGLEAPPPGFARDVAKATLETLAVSIAGISLAVLLALPLTLLGTGTLWLREPLRRRDSPASRAAGRGVYGTGRSMMALMRAVPEVLWAMLLVKLVGLGPLAGVLAIGVTYGAMLAKVYSELLEAAPAGPMEALRSTGASIPAVFVYAMVPQVRGLMLGYTLYRWECAMRASAVLGIVGAGGLGFQILLAWRFGQYGELLILLAVLVALVCVTDGVSSLLRRRWFHAAAPARA